MEQKSEECYTFSFMETLYDKTKAEPAELWDCTLTFMPLI